MKLIAFYLPQYHPIPENNQWWGPGFTEWTNVAQARPRFNGHYQPHIPADLGFYDLRLEETRIAQAALAAEYGIGGFCYYHYWFNGKMLLEQPLNEVLQSGKPDFPFCVCWANENWTRRWDGQEQEILMEQNYETYDAAVHMKWLCQAFRDHRYITIEGKPLFLIYRAGDILHLPDKLKVWKDIAQQYGFPGIYLCYVKNFQASFSEEEFIKMGFDAILNFEPRSIGAPLPISVPGAMVYRYQDFINRAITKPIKDYIEIPCVMPSWDNSARRKDGAVIIQNTDPEKYRNWLRHAMTSVLSYPETEQFVFINAWNEWGEGCHLEPDLKNGHAFLTATRQVLKDLQDTVMMNSETDQDYMPRNVQNLINEDYWTTFIANVCHFRPVFIWGAGDGGCKTLAGLEKTGITIAGFIDNNAEKWGSQLQGIPIFSPETLYRSENHPFIVVASMYRDEIMTDLMRNGFIETFDFLPDYRLPKKNLEDNTIQLFVNEKAVQCNICNGDLFQEGSFFGNDLKCAKCGSFSRERMVVAALIHEYAVAGLTWLSENYKLNILEISGQRAYSAYLRLQCNSQTIYYLPGFFKNLMQTDSLPKEYSLLPFNSQHFSAVIAVEYLNSPVYTIESFMEIYRVLENGGVLFLYIDNVNYQSLDDCGKTEQIIFNLKSIGFQVGVVQQDYPIHAINYQKIFICRKFGVSTIYESRTKSNL